MQRDYIDFKPGSFIFKLLFAIAMMFCSPLRCEVCGGAFCLWGMKTGVYLELHC